MKEYIKPAVETVNFATEAITEQGVTDPSVGGGATPLSVDELEE